MSAVDSALKRPGEGEKREAEAVKAAYDYDPKEAIGLDGALQKLAHALYGPFLLRLSAAGLIAYGVYCLVDARLRDVSANT